jgi:hypothetical protein
VTTATTTLERAGELKQELTDFVLDAEGELATALETFSAAQLTRAQQQDMNQRSLVVDRFVTEGQVGDRTPIDLFIEETPDLSESDRQLLKSWRRSFVGLFAIVRILEDGFELMNWTTAKHYLVKPSDAQELAKMARLKEGEIILAQIAPVSDAVWMFSSPWTAMGRLGKPKLAVAIGNFKQNYKNHLYSDAPELLAEAWRSVEKYHQDFIDFFGGDEVTLPGYQLNKKLNEFQELMTKKRLEEAGIDSSKSMDELVEEAGVSEEELATAAEAMGADEKTVAQFFDGKGKTKMVAPQIELPAPLKKAEQVTVLTHPRWGQFFLPAYGQFKAMLEAEDWKSIPNAEDSVRRNLKDPEMNAFVWHHLAQQYPDQLQAILRDVLQRPTFDLKRDLDELLLEYDKRLETELPEIASVPIHLHNLFQEAVVEISKDKAKKTKKKTTAGFQR